MRCLLPPSPALTVQAKSVPQPLGSRGAPEFFTGNKLQALLQSEAPTYMWMWQTIRNMWVPSEYELGGSV
jgi:hypothetical protein